MSMNFHRREILRVLSFASAQLITASSFSQETIRRKLTLYEHKSDFDVPSEFTTSAATFQFSNPSAEDLARYNRVAADRLVGEIFKVTTEYASSKINRKDNEKEITEFLNTVGEMFIYKGAFVAFCAAGISFAACQAFCRLNKIVYNTNDRVRFFRKTILPIINYYYFYPTSCVPEMQSESASRKKWVDEKESIQPLHGWFVVFSFLKNRKPSHVGIIDSASEKLLKTVEYNTKPDDAGNQQDGGWVAQKTRKRNGSVLGYIKTY